MNTYPSSTYKRPRANRSLLEQGGMAALMGVALFAGVSIIGLLFFEVLFAGRIFPGVVMNGVDLGGLSSDAANAKIASHITFSQTGHIAFQDRGQSWVVTPGDVGLFIDPEGSFKAAFAVGRSSNLIENLTQQFGALVYGRRVSPVTVFDQRLAYAYLSSLADKIDQPPVEASLSINNNGISIQPAKPGRTLDVYASINLLSAQLLTLQDGIIPLNVVETLPAELDVNAQTDLARSILSQPLTLTLPNGQNDAGPWVIDPASLGNMLMLERVNKDGKEIYQVAVDKTKLTDYLSRLAPTAQQTPQNARFIFNDDTRQLDLIQHAVIGRVLDVPASIKAIDEKLVAGQHTIALEFIVTPPAVGDDATADKLQIKELIQKQTSYFRGSSADRVHNIQVAASRFHGVLVPPGSTFSMSDTMGDVSLDNGYAEALIIQDGRTIQGVGGGVCQVSTTLFRTVFFAGFPVVERYAHAYRVHYYEQTATGSDSKLAGLDATVYVPLVDFQFSNNTPYWLLMEVYVNPGNSSITWKFYSTSDGRKVDWNTTGPQNIVKPPEPLLKQNNSLAANEVNQTDWAAEGSDITVNRTVTRSDGSVLFQDTITTHYQPWRAIYEYGPETSPQVLDELKRR